MGALNLYVAYNYSTSAWANFKAFGTTGLILVFTVAQGLYLSRHLPDPSNKDEGDTPQESSKP